MACSLFTIDKGEVGKTYLVLGLSRLLDLDKIGWEVATRRLWALGVKKGDTIGLVSRLSPKGPFIISSMGTQISICKNLARAIWVEEIPEP